MLPIAVIVQWVWGSLVGLKKAKKKKSKKFSRHSQGRSTMCVKGRQRRKNAWMSSRPSVYYILPWGTNHYWPLGFTFNPCDHQVGHVVNPIRYPHSQCLSLPLETTWPIYPSECIWFAWIFSALSSNLITLNATLRETCTAKVEWAVKTKIVSVFLTQISRLWFCLYWTGFRQKPQTQRIHCSSSVCRKGRIINQGNMCFNSKTE